MFVDLTAEEVQGLSNLLEDQMLDGLSEAAGEQLLIRLKRIQASQTPEGNANTLRVDLPPDRGLIIS